MYAIIPIRNRKPHFIQGVDEQSQIDDNLAYQKPYIYRITYKNNTVTTLDQYETCRKLTRIVLTDIR